MKIVDSRINPPFEEGRKYRCRLGRLLHRIVSHSYSGTVHRSTEVKHC